MALRIPQNQIILGKYTSGNEYMFVANYNEYTGYFYEFNGKIYAGKEYSSDALEIIRLDSSKVNKLLINPNTSIYGRISGNSIPPKALFSSISSTSAEARVRYFAKKINTQPYLIKEIDEDTFNSLQTNPLYQVIKVNYSADMSDTELNLLETKMTGIKAYITSINVVTSTNEDNPYIS